jgi:hypothetical protein
VQGCAKLYRQAAEAALAIATVGEQILLRDGLQVTRFVRMPGCMKAYTQRECAHGAMFAGGGKQRVRQGRRVGAAPVSAERKVVSPLLPSDGTTWPAAGSNIFARTCAQHSAFDDVIAGKGARGDMFGDIPKKIELKFCGSCPACSYRTKTPDRDCKFGSKCTRKDCMYAHACPAGTNHMAGSTAIPCKSGIQCTLSTCSFAHPSKSLVCTNQDEGDPGTSRGPKVYAHT